MDRGFRCLDENSGCTLYSKTGHQDLEDGERRYICEAGQREDEHGMEREVVLHDPGKGSSAGRADRTSDTDDGGDRTGGEHVGRGREEVRRPTLMGGGGECDEGDGRRRAVRREAPHVRDEN